MFKKSFKTVGILAGTVALSAGLGWSQPAAASEPFIGQIETFGFNFPPRGWAFCDGQLLPIASNTALFSLMGTTFGGDGRTTFALPDLRGRTAVHPGQGPGLPRINWGQRGGDVTHTLTVANMPAHNHAATTTVDSVSLTLKGTNGSGDSATPGGNSLASKNRTNIYSTNAPNVAMHAGSITGSVTASTTTTTTGGGQAFSIRDPFLGIYHSIALHGVFPSRN